MRSKTNYHELPARCRIPTAAPIKKQGCMFAAGEMLHVAEPFLDRNLHPTAIVRGFHRALEDAVKIVDEMAFPIDVNDRDQMLKILNSCIGTKYTARFGTLLAVRHLTTERERVRHGMLPKIRKPIRLETERPSMFLDEASNLPRIEYDVPGVLYPPDFLQLLSACQ